MYERVKELCKDRGLTIQTLERMAGLANGTIGKWKIKSPKSESVKAVARVLSVTTDYLLTGEDPAHPEQADIEMREYLQQIRDDPNIRAMFDLVEDATPEEIKAAVAFLKTLRSQGRNDE